MYNNTDVGNGVLNYEVIGSLVYSKMSRNAPQPAWSSIMHEEPQASEYFVIIPTNLSICS
jgi:hypothetical protein